VRDRTFVITPTIAIERREFITGFQ